jgi:TolB protein
MVLRSRSRVALVVAAVGLLAAVLLLVTLPASAGAADYWAVSKIYDDETHVEMGAGNTWGFEFAHQRLVWSRAYPDQAAYGVLMAYDLATGDTLHIPDGYSDEPMQDVMGRYLVWHRYTSLAPAPRSADICLYDLLEDHLHLISDDPTPDTAPRIWDDVVVWERGEANRDIWSYDIGAGVSFQHNIFGDDRNPSLCGNWVAWEVGAGADREIMVYNVVTAAAQKLTYDHVADHDPIVIGDQVVWLHGEREDTEIYIEQVMTGRGSRITTNDLEEHSLKAAGGKLAWVEGRDSQSEICLYDLQTHDITHLTDNDLGDMNVDLDGQSVVWQEEVDGDWEIMLYDTSDGTTLQFTSNSVDDVDPTVSNWRIAWRQGTVDYTVPHAPRVEWDVMLAARTFFADVAHIEPYYEAINGLAGAGYVGGYASAHAPEFHPEGSLYRAQLAKMICETLERRVTESRSYPFTDLGPDNPNNLYPHEYVGVAADLGIIRGTGPGQFSPYLNVSRGQAVTMIVRAAMLVPGFHLEEPTPGYAGTLGIFDDIHGKTMAVAEYNGLLAGLQGFGLGWDPWAPASRGETAQLLWNLMEHE